MKRRLTPQEKKLLSYARDGRNTMAEARSKAHRAIRLRKQKANRALRHAENGAVGRIGLDEDDAFVARTGRRSWRKYPDAPLAEYVQARLDVRESTGMDDRAPDSLLRSLGRRRASYRAVFMKGSLQVKPPGTNRTPYRASVVAGTLELKGPRSG